MMEAATLTGLDRQRDPTVPTTPDRFREHSIHLISSILLAHLHNDVGLPSSSSPPASAGCPLNLHTVCKTLLHGAPLPLCPFEHRWAARPAAMDGPAFRKSLEAPGLFAFLGH